MVVYLLLNHGASFRKCNSSESTMLHRTIINEHIRIVQLLLLKGASLTCKDRFGRTPLVTYLHNGGEWIDVLLSEFTVSLAIECGKPFNSSVYHLLSYRHPTLDDDNFFNSTKCNYNLDDPVCKVKKGPLAEAIESHPRRHGIINSCPDAEGFTALHRAAQGANVVAIRYLLANGANDSILSLHGHDALKLAVLHAGSNLWRLYGFGLNGQFLGITQASDAAIELLHHAMKSRGYKIRCDSSKPELTLYHLAASRGLVKFIELLFTERESHQLDVNCPNADGITPMYLAKLFGNEVESDLYNPWEHVIHIIKSQGGEMRYPKKDAEYNIVYSRLYGWIPNEFTLDLRPDIIHFITSLLTSYEKSENRSFRCSFGSDPDSIYYWHVIWIWKEIHRIVVSMKEFLDLDHLSFQRDMKRCSWKMEQFRQYLSRFYLRRRTYPQNIAKTKKWETFNKAQRNWFKKELLNLMQLRHKEVFGSFACSKSLSYKFKPRLDAQSLTFQIRQYEESIPYFYLRSICQDLYFLFEDYLSHVKRNQMPSEFIFSESEVFSRPGFVGERMQILTGSSSTGTPHLGRLTFEWPLEFLVKRSLGFFHRYDYLKTLHVGIEPSTHVSLYTEKIRQSIEELTYAVPLPHPKVLYKVWKAFRKI